MDFAASIPDFRRSSKGNLRHSLNDIVMLLILGRLSGKVCRAEIIQFGIHNLGKLRKLGMLKNGVSSEATLCRIENGIDELDMADRMREFAETFHKELLKGCYVKDIICIDSKAMCGTAQ